MADIALVRYFSEWVLSVDLLQKDLRVSAVPFRFWAGCSPGVDWLWSGHPCTCRWREGSTAKLDFNLKRRPCPFHCNFGLVIRSVFVNELSGFAILYSLGNLLALIGTFFLAGPTRPGPFFFEAAQRQPTMKQECTYLLYTVHASTAQGNFDEWAVKGAGLCHSALWSLWY